MLRRSVIALCLLLALGVGGPAAFAAEAQAQTFEVDIRGRKIVGNQTIRVKRGDQVTLRWTSDEPVSIHLHGYDLETVVQPGTPAAFTVQAYATGRFPITAHGFGAQSHGGGHSETVLGYLEVHPR